MVSRAELRHDNLFAMQVEREESKSKYQKTGGGWDDPTLAIPRKRMRIV